MLVAQKIIDVCKAIVIMGETCMQSNLPEMAEAFEKISLEILGKFVNQNYNTVSELIYSEIQKLKEGKPKINDGYPVCDTKIHVIKAVRERLSVDLLTAKKLVEKYIRKICNGEI